jgi:transposase
MIVGQHKRSLHECELLRKSGMQLLAQGATQASVACRLGVSPRSVSRWAKSMREREQAWRSKPLGRPALLDAEKKGRIREMLQRGATAYGFSSEPWTQQRIVELIQREFGLEFRKEKVWGLVKMLGLM